MPTELFGLVVNANGNWPSGSEIADLNPRWLRSLVYNFEDFETALGLLPAVNPPRIIALLNSETHGVENDFSGWASTVAAFADRFAGRVSAVELLNEWDSNDGVAHPPGKLLAADAAALIAEAATILQLRSITPLLGSVAGTDWPQQLQQAIDALQPDDKAMLGGVCLHPYGKPAADFPPRFVTGFGDIVDAVNTAHSISGLPVWLTEFGINLIDSDGEDGQREYLTRAYKALATLTDDVLVTACYFAANDGIISPGEPPFGLRTAVDGRARPAWDAFRALANAAPELTHDTEPEVAPEEQPVEP